MISTLDAEIRPSHGLGMFELGMSLWTVLDMLPKLQHFFPQVDVKYDPDIAPTTPVVLHIRPHIDLLFSGKQQRLRTICVRKLRDPNPPVILRYRDETLSSADKPLRRLDVSKVFGPTYPTANQNLRYPGIVFSFDDETSSSAAVNQDRMQEVKKVLVVQKDADDTDALAEVQPCPAMDGDISVAIVKVHNGITLHFHNTDSKPLQIQLGHTNAQELMLDLGPPLRIHYKDDDRMTIHSTHHESEEYPNSSYFYNYFQHGLDFYICGTSHVVKKIVLHTNVPGSPLFQRYKRCNWEIEGPPEDDEDDTPPRKKFTDRFETISHFLSPHNKPPSMLLDRTNDEDSLTLPNPATKLYGYDGIVLEVSESSSVVSITLF